MGKYGLHSVFLSLSDQKEKEKLQQMLEKEGILTENTFRKEKSPELVIVDHEEGVSERISPMTAMIRVVPDFNSEIGFRADLLVEGIENIDLSLIYRTFCHKRGIPYQIGENEEIIVRELQESDMDAYITITREEHILNVLPDGHLSEEEQRERLKSHIKETYRFYGCGIYGIFLKKEARLIGAVSLSVKKGFEKVEYETGFFLSYYYLRKGYGIMALEFLIEYAFAVIGVKRLFSITAGSNLSARAFLEKMGFFLEKKEENAIYVFSEEAYRRMKRTKNRRRT